MRALSWFVPSELEGAHQDEGGGVATRIKIKEKKNEKAPHLFFCPSVGVMPRNKKTNKSKSALLSAGWLA